MKNSWTAEQEKVLKQIDKKFRGNGGLISWKKTGSTCVAARKTQPNQGKGQVTLFAEPQVKQKEET